MLKAETPSPAHTSKKGQKKCDSCDAFMSDLDPRPFLRCGQSLPSLRPPLPGHVEEMGAPADCQKVLFNHEGTQGGVGKGGGGGTRLVRYSQQFHLPPKLIPPVG